jgi:hypothetical protein
MKTAELIKDVSGKFIGCAVLYKLDPPLDGHVYVVASGVDAMFSGPETLIFPANKNGDVVDWGEIGGSRGFMNPNAAIQDEGYEIV